MADIGTPMNVRSLAGLHLTDGSQQFRTNVALGIARPKRSRAQFHFSH
jgi:hypothetical protein